MKPVVAFVASDASVALGLFTANTAGIFYNSGLRRLGKWRRLGRWGRLDRWRRLGKWRRLGRYPLVYSNLGKSEIKIEILEFLLLIHKILGKVKYPCEDSPCIMSEYR